MLKVSIIVTIIILISLLGAVVAGGEGSIVVLAGSVLFCGMMAFLVIGSRYKSSSSRDLTPKIAEGTVLEEKDEDSKTRRSFIINICIIGFLLRILLGIFLLIVDTHRYMDGDAYVYEGVGKYTAEYWQGKHYYPNLRLQRNPHPSYYYYNAVIFYVFGENRFIPKVISCSLGTYLIFLIYSLCLRCFGFEVARIGAILTALFPSLILWSAINTRDIWAVVALAGLMDQSLKIKRNIEFTVIIRMAFFLLMMITMRHYLLPVALFAIGLSTVLTSGKNLMRNFILFFTIFCGVIFLGENMGIRIVGVENVNLEHVNALRSNLSLTMGDTRTAYMSDADISTPISALRYFPAGLLYFLFSPFPWMINFSIPRQLMSFPENVLWYYLFYKAIIGVRVGLKNNNHYINTILIFIICFTIPYALVEGNVGTAYRHRAQIVVLVNIFSAVGIVYARKRKMEVLNPIPV